MKNRDRAPMVRFRITKNGVFADLVIFDHTRLVKGFAHVNECHHATLFADSIQELIETLELVWPEWLDHDQYERVA